MGSPVGDLGPSKSPILAGPGRKRVSSFLLPLCGVVLLAPARPPGPVSHPVCVWPANRYKPHYLERPGFGATISGLDVRNGLVRYRGPSMQPGAAHLVLQQG
jgi:hypothetical protein